MPVRTPSAALQVGNSGNRGKKCDDALFALAETYRSFVREHHALYRVIMAFLKLDNLTLEQEAGRIILPIQEVLSSYG